MDTYHLGPRPLPLRVRLQERAAYSTEVVTPSGWGETAPELRFPDATGDAATWAAVVDELDPTIARFTVPAATWSSQRTNREPAELWHGDTPLGAGRVVRRGVPTPAA